MLFLYLTLCIPCAILKGINVNEDIETDGNSCLAFSNSSSFGPMSKIIVSLSDYTNNLFYGIDNNDTPSQIILKQNNIDISAYDLNYLEFTKPSPIFCNVDLTEDKINIIKEIQPYGQTINGFDISLFFDISINNSKYLEIFGHNGNCITLSRRISQIDFPEISAGTCVGIFIGLGLSCGFLSAFIIYQNITLNKTIQRKTANKPSSCCNEEEYVEDNYVDQATKNL
ncbi:hypothetical protein TRFO_34487 [Tritrichomonas foetus]|uniref:Uncharacterized protein n=1 Tax=Tritrichomonas foetus TaxID=1144522 RepID=A0A1J4JL44_9EUKA|nr:hypothetical protein TRFO_34487 [Tritrichomonas foetus]|eukprot:OHS99135.1 hypothetical protein TRFO_34487 [Tritrichomonas foetus]